MTTCRKTTLFANAAIIGIDLDFYNDNAYAFACRMDKLLHDNPNPYPAKSDRAAKRKYNEYAGLVGKVFADGLLYVNGVHDHPKASKAYSIAWEHGHSSGYAEVSNYFDELVDLLK